ncbi:MAG: S-layer homology domain-containing protein, partial [Oscillibacter sp.]|nr:S-layer homology domain-containing protein [Oscillibacter sp.]
LTRGAAAKIICNMVLGPTTAAALGVDAKPFSDVAVDNVFAGYIAYCAKQGIINGYADGTFRPAGLVTGNQFMKMLLGALGYDGKIEGFTGDNWSVNVMKLAKNIGLDDGLTETFVGSAAMNREEACLYAFNTMKATMVEYDSQTNITIGGTNVTVGNSKAKDMTWSNLNDDGYSTKDDTIKKDGKVQFAEKYFSDLKKTTADSDDFGRPANEWKYKSSTIGNYASGDNLLATYTKGVDKGDLYDLIGKDAYNDLTEVNNSTYTATLTVYQNGDVAAVATNTGIADYIVKNSSGTATGTGNGVLTEVYMDDDNNVTIVEISTFVVQATEDYSSKNEEVTIDPVGDTEDLAPSLDTALSSDDFDVTGVKEDDYLLVTATKDQAAGTSYSVFSVAAAKTVKGSVTSYSTGSNVTIGGTKYSYSASALKTTDTAHSDGAAVKSTGYTINETASVVLDAYGYIIAVDDAAVSSGKYVFIQDTDVSGLKNNVTAAAYFTDGTYKEIAVGKYSRVVSGSTVTDAVNDEGTAASFVPGWYTYSVDSNSKYTLKNVSDDDKVAASQSFTGNATSVMTNGTSLLTDAATAGWTAPAAATSNQVTVKANNSTVVVTLDNDDNISVYTGVSKLPTIKTATSDSAIKVYYVCKSTGYATFVFVDMSAANDAKVDDATSSSDEYVFLLTLDSINQDAKDNEYYTYNAIVDGKETTINLDGAAASTYTLYTTIKTGDDGYVNADDLKIVGTHTTSGKYDHAALDDAAITYSDGVLTIDNVDWTVTSSTKIYLVVKGDTDSDGIKGIMSDDDADYETSCGITASSLKTTLKGYTVDGDAYAIRTDSDSSTTSLSALYVYVSAASNS